MMSEDITTSSGKAQEDSAMLPVPESKREHWLSPATVFAGLEFSIPVLMVGSVLIGAFGFGGMIPVVLFTFLIITWAGNSLSCYIGARTGLPSPTIARQSFGDKQAKFIIAMVIGGISMAWWAVTTSVTGNAISVLLGIDYVNNRLPWVFVTIAVGVLFAIPSVLGYNSMKWTDYIAVPGGLLLCIAGVWLALRNVGWNTIINSRGDGSLTFAAGVTTILGLNISQMVISADYSRYAKPRVLDNILMPLGIIVVGVPMIIIGGVMGVGQGSADIVQVMVALGFPFWGFLVLWLASWTSQLVNNYSMGLAFANILNIHSNRGRIYVTIAGTILSLGLALIGILDRFMDFLYLAALTYPGIASVIFVDSFIRKFQWKDRIGWNWMATIALAVAIAVGYVTAYLIPIGIPPLQALIISGIVYYLAMVAKKRISPDVFTEGF